MMKRFLSVLLVLITVLSVTASAASAAGNSLPVPLTAASGTGASALSAVGAEPTFTSVSIGDNLESLKTYLESDGNYICNITADLDARIGEKGDDNAPYVPYWCTLGQGTKVVNLNGHKLTLANDKQLHHHRMQLVMTMLLIPAGAELVINDAANSGEINYDGALAELHHQEGYSDYGRYEQNRDLISVQGGRLTVNGGRLIAGRSEKIWASNLLVWNYYYRQINGCAIDMTKGEVEIRGGVIYGRGFSYLFDDRQTRTAAIKASSGSLKIYDGDIQGMGCADVLQIGSGADVSIYGGNYRTHKQDYEIVSYSTSLGADHNVHDEDVFAPSYGSIGIPSRAIREIGVKTTVWQQDNGFLTADDMQDEPLDETSKNVVIRPTEQQSGSMFAWNDDMGRFDLMPVIAEYTWDKKSPLKFEFQHPYYYPALMLRSYDSIQSYTHSVTAAALRTTRDGMNYVPSLRAQNGRDWVDLNDLPQSSKDKLAVGQTYWLRMIDQEQWNNGSGQNTITYKDDKYITVKIVAPERLSTVACHLAIPAKDHKPDMHPITDESDKYSVELVKWFYKLDGGSREFEIGADDTFVAGRYYTARLKFTGKNGYAVTSQTAATANGWSTEAKGDGIFDASFMIHEEPEELSSANCTVKRPVGGEKPDFSPVSADPTAYTVEAAKWTTGVGARETSLTADSVFEAGVTYTVYVRYTANPGFVFANDAMYKINGRLAASNGRGLYEMSYTVAAPPATEISSLSCAVTEPVAGAKPDHTAVTNADEPYTAAVGMWHVGVGRNARVMSPDESFIDGETYEAYVVFTPSGDYTISSDAAAMINGRAATRETVRTTVYYSVIFKAETAAPAHYTVGDVDSNGEVTNRDAVILDRYIAGWTGYDAQIKNWDAADLDRKGDVTNRDAVYLDRYIAGWVGYDAYIIEV